MKIYLLDINKEMTDVWAKQFEHTNVEIVNKDFETFMAEHPDIEAIVSPANSFGLMDGGYDKAITNYFGPELMKDVQEKIIKVWWGEQPVGTSLSVVIKSKHFIKQLDDGKTLELHPILIHTPTMRTPEQIVDARIIYQCMRTTLIEAVSQKVDSIVIPAFGGCTGKVSCEIIAKMMRFAFDQLSNVPENLNWGYAYHIVKRLTEATK